MRGRVVTKEAFDPKTGTTRELASTPLVLARNGAFLEARIEPLPLPAKMTAKISFTCGRQGKPLRFRVPCFLARYPRSRSHLAHPSPPPHLAHPSHRRDRT